MHPSPQQAVPPPYVMLQDQGPPGHYPGPHGRNPHRFKGQYRPNGHKKNGCLKCYCCCYCCIFITLVLFIAALAIGFVLLAPKVPKYSIGGFSVKAFNMTPDFSLHTHFTVTVKAENPNRKITILYGKGSSVKLMYSGMKLCSGEVPNFRQPTRNTTMISVDMKGDLKGSDFGGSIGETLMEKIKSGRIPVTVEVSVPVNIGFGETNISPHMMGVYINCSMVVNNLSEPGKDVKISDTKYEIKFAWKFGDKAFPLMMH